MDRSWRQRQGAGADPAETARAVHRAVPCAAILRDKAAELGAMYGAGDLRRRRRGESGSRTGLAGPRNADPVTSGRALSEIRTGLGIPETHQSLKQEGGVAVRRSLLAQGNGAVEGGVLERYRYRCWWGRGSGRSCCCSPQGGTQPAAEERGRRTGRRSSAGGAEGEGPHPVQHPMGAGRRRLLPPRSRPGHSKPGRGDSIFGCPREGFLAGRGAGSTTLV